MSEGGTQDSIRVNPNDNPVFNKGGTQDSIRVNPNDNPNNTIKEKIAYIMDNFFPGRTTNDDFNFTPVIGSIDPILIEDLELVFKGLKGGKAPALDRIDYRRVGGNSICGQLGVSENAKINPFTDSLSSMLALQSASSRSNFVNKAKNDLYKAKNLVGLSWVKAHVGIQGNELADQQAKLATTTGEELSIPAPRSFLNRTLKQLILHEWCGYWNKYTSASGTRVRSFLDTVSSNFLIYNKILIYFLSGHGSFPFYLHRFNKINSPLCTCGLVGDVDHYVFECSLTRKYHLIKPTEASKEIWF
ncbi:hypothetical protein AVEN_79535-1 [Araneus ventricosus]|uniref:Uncharacterized protein n=1 Tax=Araneus ventricosus TaxID=182803 RepID=A0A4Y2NA15_ARAVE|nr:hypothetical protein AVEN_79535-1 [Araneus ventricosus]